MYGELGRELIVRMTVHEANLLATIQAVNKMENCSPECLRAFHRAVEQKHETLRVDTMLWVTANLAVLDEVLDKTPWAKAYITEAKCVMVSKQFGENIQENQKAVEKFQAEFLSDL